MSWNGIIGEAIPFFLAPDGVLQCNGGDHPWSVTRVRKCRELQIHEVDARQTSRR